MNIPSKENPDDRPQPPQRMNSEERSNEEIRADLARLGRGGMGEVRAYVRRLVADVPPLLARIAAVEATVRSAIAHAEWVTEDLDHRKLFPTVDVIQPLRAVLAASPTPTGPEPARCGEFNPGTRSWYRCTEPQGHDGDHVVQRPGFSSVYARWPGPATPEPTEETP